MIRLNENRRERAIWLRWMVFNAIGWLAAWGVGSMILAGLVDDLSPTAAGVFQAAAAFVLGTGVAAVQWLGLRGHFTGAARWIVAGGAGFCAAAVIAMPIKLWDLYLGPSGFQLDEVAYGTIFGLCLGMGQWVALRTWVRRAAWWIWGSALGWTLGMIVGEVLPLTWPSPPASLVFALATQTVPSAVTGLALIWLLRHKKPHRSRAAGDFEG